MILLVDDRIENIIPIQSFLNEKQLSVDTALSGEEALRKVLQNDYSLILLDVQMPDIDGFEVAETLSGINKAKDIPIIFLTAINIDKENITKGFQSGAIDYLTKPIDLDILLLKVNTYRRLFLQQQELITTQEYLKQEIKTRKKIEENLSILTQELNSIIETLPFITFTMDLNYDIEFVNQLWYKYSSDSKTFPQFHPDDTLDLPSLRNEYPEGFHKIVRIRDNSSGNYIFFNLKITPMYKNGELMRWIGSFEDIHHQKLTTEFLEKEINIRSKELIEKNKELEDTNYELQQFVWVVSHDLKEPLRKIQTINGIIKNKFLAEDTESHEFIDRTIRSAARMSNLISDLLEYSRLSANRDKEQTDLNVLIKDVLSDYEDAIEKKRICFKIDQLPTLNVFPSRLRQVFQNLISNSIKFTRENCIPSIEIFCETLSEKSFDSVLNPEGGYLKISVKDNGIGFDEQFLDRIFVIFQQLNPKDKYDGTGIGLAITKKIIDNHDGIITAESTLNEGSVFKFILPI